MEKDQLWHASIIHPKFNKPAYVGNATKKKDSMASRPDELMDLVICCGSDKS